MKKTLIGGLVAPLVDCARIAGGLAVEQRVAGLLAVAVEPVVAQPVVGDVVAEVGALVARVVGAGYPVVAVHVRAPLAVE